MSVACSRKEWSGTADKGDSTYLSLFNHAGLQIDENVLFKITQDMMALMPASDEVRNLEDKIKTDDKAS